MFDCIHCPQLELDRCFIGELFYNKKVWLTHSELCLRFINLCFLTFFSKSRFSFYVKQQCIDFQFTRFSPNYASVCTLKSKLKQFYILLYFWEGMTQTARAVPLVYKWNKRHRQSIRFWRHWKRGICLRKYVIKNQYEQLFLSKISTFEKAPVSLAASLFFLLNGNSIRNKGFL